MMINHYQLCVLNMLKMNVLLTPMETKKEIFGNMEG